ncbi:LOW QUALITY PROTEIN: uncharacterized protein, partial [Procambarus clarkii]|uniref:LOW QUALITY PROTEIN: uncharacterized protein n=1 Tax=Procambarus clarkii TaxID=6728 RepID=UPI003742C91E
CCKRRSSSSRSSLSPAPGQSSPVTAPAGGRKDTSATTEGRGGKLGSGWRKRSGSPRKDEASPAIVVTTTTSSPEAPPVPPEPTSIATTLPAILEPSRVEGANVSAASFPLALQPSTHSPYRLPPVATASRMQTVFDSNGVFTITTGSTTTRPQSRPQSVIGQQPLTILPLLQSASSNTKHNNNTQMYTENKDERLTLSSSGSEKSRAALGMGQEFSSDHPTARRQNCCDRACDNASILCCMVCNCTGCHCDLCCLLCRICVAI